MALTDGAILELSRHFRFQWEPAQQAHVLLYPEGMIKLPGSSGEILKRVNGTVTVGESWRTWNAHFQTPICAATLSNFWSMLVEKAGSVPNKTSLPLPLWLLAEVSYKCPLHCVFCYNPVDYATYGTE